MGFGIEAFGRAGTWNLMFDRLRGSQSQGLAPGAWVSVLGYRFRLGLRMRFRVILLAGTQLPSIGFDSSVQV